MIGVGRDEFNGGVYTNTSAGTVVANTAAQYRQLVRRQFGSRAGAVMRLYPLRRFPSPAPFIAYRTIMADAFSVCPAVVSDARVGKHIPVYAYEDDDADSPNPVGQSLPVRGSPSTPETPATQPLGAFHSGINHLAHDPMDALDPNQAALQNEVLAEWTGFGLTGNPNVANTPPWTRYTRHRRALMSYRPAGDSTLTPTRTIRREHNCASGTRSTGRRHGRNDVDPPAGVHIESRRRRPRAGAHASPAVRPRRVTGLVCRLSQRRAGDRDGAGPRDAALDAQQHAAALDDQRAVGQPLRLEAAAARARVGDAVGVLEPQGG
jgi:hypothetical protein